MLKTVKRGVCGVVAMLTAGVSLGFGSGLPKASVQAIIKSLQDSNVEVRTAAGLALAQAPDRSAAKPLETALMASADANEQDALAKALEAVNDSGSIKRLSDALANPQFTWGAGSKPKAIEVIGRIGQTDATKWLTAIVGSEQDPAVRAAAIRTLGEIGAPKKKETK